MDKTAADRWLEQAVKTHGDNLLRLCFLYLRDRQMAEDAVQETFLRAWRAYGRFRGDSSEKTWLTRIAVNVCKSALRRERPLPLSEAAEGSYEARFRDRDRGRSISMEAILHSGHASEFILSTWPEQAPAMVDCHLDGLDTDVTLVKFSDTHVMYLLLADTVSYNGHINFDQPPKDLFKAAVDVLETLHD